MFFSRCCAVALLMLASNLTASGDLTSTSTLRLLERIQDTIKNPFHEKASIPTWKAEDCLNASLVSEELPFGGEDKTVPVRSNLTWGMDVLRPLLCATEYVVLYQDADDDDDDEDGEVEDEAKSLTPLCRSFDVRFHAGDGDKDDGGFFSCRADLDESLCGRKINVVLEVWLVTGSLLQATDTLNVDCEGGGEAEEQEDEEGAPTHVGPPLALPAPVVGSSCSWTEWTEWSGCPITCGDRPGIRKRTKRQTGSKLCVRTKKEEKPCVVNRCPRDCVLSPWGDWSACSTTCGTGTRSRDRTVARREEFGGRRCPGSGTRVESEPCNGGGCAADGGWSSWRPWGYCDAPCGQGARRRLRVCDAPRPENGGKPCRGEAQQAEPCKIKDCAPVPGGWSPWSRWSACDADCGRGNITRTRTCSEPAPMHGGEDCRGHKAQNRRCFLRRCATVATTTTEKTTTTTTAKEEEVQAPRQGGQTDEVHEKVDSSHCLFPAPHLSGFVGPFATPKTDGEVESPNLRVRVGGHAFYRCSRGKVVDARSNARAFALACDPDTRTFSNGDDVPECRAPELCVGPLPVRRDALGTLLPLLLGMPRRDHKVNSAVSLICPGEERAMVRGSCFADGIVRYQRDPPCEDGKGGEGEEGSPPRSGRRCSQEKPVRVQLSSPGEFGWLEHTDGDGDDEGAAASLLDILQGGQAGGGGNTDNPFKVVSSVFETLLTMAPKKDRNSSQQKLILPQVPLPARMGVGSGVGVSSGSRCKYLVEAPVGFALRLGVERLPRTVRITDVHSGEEISLFDAFNSGRGSVTSEGSVVAVEAKMRPGESFRMNYQVVEP